MRDMRRLLLLTSAMIFFDVAFFAAIAPLLPGYVDDLGLSKAQAGILTASYAAGTLIGSLPAGFVASRVGPRRSVICGLLLLGVASLVFGFVDQIGLLDAARFTQGIAGALIWSGALTWLITAAPEERRGSVIGTALGTAVAGALLGPALGAIAASVGTEPVFGSVLVITALLALAASRLPEAQAPEQQSLREVAATMVSRPILDATAFVAVALGDVRRDRGAGAAADRRPRRRPRGDRRRLHRRRGPGGGAGAARRPLLGPGRAQDARTWSG